MENIAAEAKVRDELLSSQERILSKWSSHAKEILARYPHLNLHLHQVARYLEAFGPDEALQMLEAFSKSAVMKSIRVNTILAKPEEVLERLQSKGFSLEKHPYIWYGLIVRNEPIPVGATHEYMLGLYTVQGPASMLAVPALDPPKFGRILDMCAGAGVKTTQLSQHSPTARIVALDINWRKLLALKNNASRLAATNILAIHMDAREAYTLGTFDAILLDAPCSGEGLLHLEKGRWPRSIEDIASRVQLQYQLLKAGVRALKPGGTLLYATCSVTVEENEYVISLLLEDEEKLVVEEPPIPAGLPGITSYSNLNILPDAAKCRRFLPHHHGTEGFTLCKIRKLP